MQLIAGLVIGALTAVLWPSPSPQLGPVAGTVVVQSGWHTSTLLLAVLVAFAAGVAAGVAGSAVVGAGLLWLRARLARPGWLQAADVQSRAAAARRLALY